MLKKNIDAVLVRSTDRYFNEYVPENLSRRAFITGFNGSVGDALIFRAEKRANILFVDGRYALQAKEQVKEFRVQVMPVGQSIESGWLNYLEELGLKNKNNKILNLEIEPEKINIRLFEALREICRKNNIKIKSQKMSCLEQVFKNSDRSNKNSKKIKFRKIPKNITGLSTAEKLKKTSGELTKLGLDFEKKNY